MRQNHAGQQTKEADWDETIQVNRGKRWTKGKPIGQQRYGQLRQNLWVKKNKRLTGTKSKVNRRKS